ncbi:MAG: CpsD/CapB family tyrosine-protein kinase [Acidobacteria bacterium]|nr:CpsD/CapB family tyrosine-protein kinase [Acidobacteriota bacterium]
MKFLKTIQKRESENPTQREGIDAVDTATAELPSSDNQAPGLLSVADLRIGAPKPETALGAIVDTGIQGPEIINPPELPAPKPGPAAREFAINVERVNPRVVSITQPRSPYCEEYRNLRTQVLHKSKKRKLQAIVVASVGPSEGKSVTALNLSWLFAQTDGVRALVIDSDLRRPSLAGYLGIETNIGLSEVLTGGASLMGSLIKLQPSGLYLLPGGSNRDDVAELLSGPRFAEILDEARSHFDFIIIDAPPLGIFTDASLLINLADGAMLVVRANHTKYKDVDRILDSLPRERMLGTILNQSEVPLMDESYYKYGFYEGREPVKA